MSYGKPETAKDMEAAIDAVLYKNASGVVGGAQAHRGHTPLDDLIRGEVMAGVDSDEDDVYSSAFESEVAKARQEAFNGILDYFFADGPHPLALIRRVYAVAKALRPRLIMSMSCEDIAVICDDGGRATVSARIKRIYNRPILDNGGHEPRASFQKSSETVGKYAEAQKGNCNRRRGTDKRKRKVVHRRRGIDADKRGKK